MRTPTFFLFVRTIQRRRNEMNKAMLLFCATATLAISAGTTRGGQVAPYNANSVTDDIIGDSGAQASSGSTTERSAASLVDTVRNLTTLLLW